MGEVIVERIRLRLRLMGLAVLVALGPPAMGGLVLAVEGARQYVVKPGDTLGGISLSVGAPVSLLVTLNNLTDPNRIVAGQRLQLPDDSAAAAPPPQAPSTGEYLVRQGDSLWTVAANLGVTVKTLVEANNLPDPNRLSVGQKLTIPGGQTTGSSSQASPSTAGAGRSSGVAALLEEAASRYQLEPSLVKALAWYLSAWRSDATSPSGPVGLMQITGTAQDWVSQSLLKRPTDRNDPKDNVEIGVAYLTYLINRLGDERQGVAAYLQGPTSLARDGPNTTTSRALDTIYGSRGRFSGSGSDGSGPTPSPSPTPAPRSLAPVVQAAFQSISTDARVGAAGRNLATGDRFDIRSGETFPSASVNKVPILVEAYREFANGQLGHSSAVDSDLETMITLSDNEAANRMLQIIGEPSVNGTMASLGLGSTLLHNFFSASGQLDPGFNQSSPADMASLFVLLANDKLVGPISSQQMRALLLRNQDASKLVRGVPDGTRVVHKSGWYNGVSNDAGIIYAPRATFVLAVFCDGVPDAETGNQLIGAISKTVYDAWGT